MADMEAALKSAKVYHTGEISIPGYGERVSYKSLLDRIIELMKAHLSGLKQNPSNRQQECRVGQSVAKEVCRLSCSPDNCLNFLFEGIASLFCCCSCPCGTIVWREQYIQRIAKSYDDLWWRRGA
jgi:hypothetical protein